MVYTCIFSLIPPVFQAAFGSLNLYLPSRTNPGFVFGHDSGPSFGGKIASQYSHEGGSELGIGPCLRIIPCPFAEAANVGKVLTCKHKVVPIAGRQHRATIMELGLGLACQKRAARQQELPLSPIKSGQLSQGGSPCSKTRLYPGLHPKLWGNCMKFKGFNRIGGG